MNAWWPISGKWEAFFSGPGSDIGEVALIGGLIGAWHKVNCHVKGCPRIGRQQVKGTTWVVCRKHHPLDKPTHAHITQAHADANDLPQP